MIQTRSSISVEGPFFRNDPRKTFRQNGRVMLRGLEEEGSRDVESQYRAGQGQRAPISSGVTPNRVADHVEGRQVSTRGNPWQVTAVISVHPAAGMGGRQAVALMAAASRVEGQTGAMRKTTARLRRARKINAAELLKGIA